MNYLIVTSALFLSLISCGNKQNEISNNYLHKKEQPLIYFEFNDTVKVNQESLGKLRYNLELDSIQLSDIEERYLFFYLTTEKESLTIEEIKKHKHTMFIDTIGDGTIHFNHNFKKMGNIVLYGIIEDIIIFKTPEADGKIRIKTKETSISKDVYVIR